MTPQYILINENGDKYYYKDREMTIRHREDGPAIEYTDGSKYWYINGERHREDGPAVEFTDGHKEWHINGKKLSEEEFNLRTSPEIVLTMDEIAAKFGVEVSKLKIKK
jgi:hypothetical protein